jgi:hypothetical protein
VNALSLGDFDPATDGGFSSGHPGFIDILILLTDDILYITSEQAAIRIIDLHLKESISLTIDKNNSCRVD